MWWRSAASTVTTMIDFLVLAIMAGVGVAIVAGPLGAFTVWRRMAYFGDTLAHSALLGISLGLLLEINVNLGIVVTCGIIAIVLSALQNKTRLAVDSLLGILSHTSLALGLVVISFFSDTRVDIYSYLFGDLLTVTTSEVVMIYIVSVVSLALLLYFWRSLLIIAIDEELAKVEGKPVEFLRLLLMLLMAVVIAVAMKVVGVLLITSLLVIPAAASRRLSSSPEAMAFIAAVIAVLSVVLGLAASWFVDSPAGPSIVLGAALFFGLSYFWKSAS